VESGHRISAECGVRGSNPHSRGTGSIPAKLSFSPLCRAVARPNRPHRNPCHRRANHRWPAAPCGSGPASHRFRSTLYYTGPQKNGCGGKSDSHRPESVSKLSARPPPVRSSVPTERRNARHSREGGGIRSCLYHAHFMRPWRNQPLSTHTDRTTKKLFRVGSGVTVWMLVLRPQERDSVLSSSSRFLSFCY